MEIPIMLIAFSIPSLLYILIRSLRKHSLTESRENLGLTVCTWPNFLRAAGVFALLALISFFVLKLVPSQLLTSASQYSGHTLSARSILAVLLNEAFYVALGEEIFFRGFVGNWLFRRMGFLWGNLLQAAIFLLPHLPLLQLSQSIWPVFIIQFCAGWLQGWLLYRSKSILPGWLVHTASNLTSAISVMV